jgi:predicted DNA-binding protein (MmcQ/YjbR family)
MDIEALYNYCITKKAVTESFPFGDQTLVFKVGGKMFALISIEKVPIQINLKCNPEKAIELREEYSHIKPGYHMNKKHWNTVIIDGNLPTSLIRELIDHSYNLVIQSLTKKAREKLGL